MAVEGGEESALKARTKFMMAKANTIDADRAGKFREKADRARYAEKSREECTKAKGNQRAHFIPVCIEREPQHFFFIFFIFFFHFFKHNVLCITRVSVRHEKYESKGVPQH